MSSSRRAFLLARTFALIAFGAAAVGPVHASPSEPARTPGAAAKRPRAREQLLAGFDPRQRRVVDDHYVAKLPSGGEAELTLSPELDGFTARLLRSYRVPRAGVVAIEPKTGRLLAYVSQAQESGDATDYARDVSAPAASVFKVVTGAALLSQGVKPDTTTCYHGGSHALTRAEISDNPRLDTACVSLTSALASSTNAVFAKLALKHLSPDKLVDYAGSFGFGEQIPFDVPLPVSPIDVPSDPLEFARTAAGFWHMRMSPMHGALLAASVAEHGRMMRPYMIDELRDEQGRVVMRGEAQLHRTVLERRHADALGKMMRATVTYGTGRKSFYDPRGQPYLPGIEVAGKTGTLSEERPYRGYTWWVGFAPADAPKIAVGVLLVNSPKWRIKAPFVGREVMRHYLVEMPKKGKAEARRTAVVAKNP
jgi:penicillin-binding protein A